MACSKIPKKHKQFAFDNISKPKGILTICEVVLLSQGNERYKYSLSKIRDFMIHYFQLNLMFFKLTAEITSDPPFVFCFCFAVS